MLVYSVYGLRVLAEEPISALLPCVAGDGPIDVRIQLNRMPSWWEDRMATASGVWYRSPFEKGLTIWELEKSGWHRFLYYGGHEFLVNPREGEIWSRWPEGDTIQNSAPFLVGPILGFVLRFRGVCCLHASAVGIGRQAIAFAGRPHAGKSTTAGAFAKLGYSVVSDDIVALAEDGGTFLARPGYPRLCLWPDSAVSLYGSSDGLPRMESKGDKRYLDLTSGGHDFQTQSLPLSAIYFLDERIDAAGYPKVEPMSNHSAVVKLAANTYMNYLLDSNLRATEFHFLSRLVSAIPVRRVIPHVDASGLRGLCEAILEDHASLLDASEAIRLAIS